MKALCIANGKFRLYADSSVHRNNQPVFLPEIDGSWSACICPVVKLSRLGTHISQKFASRYYDSISAACLFMPKDLSTQLTDMPERYFVMDSAFSTGEWLKIETPDKEFKLSCGENDIIFSCDSLDVDRTIVNLSSFLTFKIGDMLVLADNPIRLDIAEGEKISALINNNPCLNIKIK